MGGSGPMERPSEYSVVDLFAERERKLQQARALRATSQPTDLWAETVSVVQETNAAQMALAKQVAALNERIALLENQAVLFKTQIGLLVTLLKHLAPAALQEKSGA